MYGIGGGDVMGRGVTRVRGDGGEREGRRAVGSVGQGVHSVGQSSVGQTVHLGQHGLQDSVESSNSNRFRPHFTISEQCF